MFAITLFSIVLFYSCYRGYRLGLGLVLARIFSLIGAYFLAIIFAEYGATILTEKTILQGLAAVFIAGFIIFVISAIIILMVLKILIYYLGRLTDDNSKLPILGAMANGLIGVCVGLTIVWFINIASTALTNGKLPADNFISNWSQNFIGGTIGATLSQQFPEAPQMVGVATYLLENPARGISDGITLANNSDVQHLLNSKKIKRMVHDRNLLGLMTAEEINTVLDDKTVQRILKETNILGNIDVSDRNAVKKQIIEEVMTTLVRVEAVKMNPRFRELTRDPELSRMINNNDVIGLLESEKAREIAQIVMASGIIK